jgi:PAS domain S-box-containing protein
VYEDEKSHQDLNQPFNKPWDRRIHARLLKRLREEGAKVVLFDILFTDPGPEPVADKELAAALRASGNVVLAADYSPTRQMIEGQVAEVTTLVLPDETFQAAAAMWGLAQLQPDSDFLVRQHYNGPASENYPTLSWAAAKLGGLPVARLPESRLKERWVRYYGGPGTIPNVSYSQALYTNGVRPGFFRNKFVLVGARPMSGNFIERRDELRSSFTRWSDKFVFMPAVEVHATTLLNLIREDWLRKTPPVAEWAISLLVALLFGAGLTRFRPAMAVLIALVGIEVTALVAILLFGSQRIWFPWLVIVGIQIPAGLLWSVVWKSVEYWFHKVKLEKERHHAEYRIREQAALLDKAQDAIFVHDFEWKPLYANKSAERLYGCSIEEMLRMVLEQSDRNAADDGVVTAVQAVLDNGEWSGELLQQTKSGAEIVVDSRWTLLRNESNEPKGILVINTNITERKKAERKILQQAALLDKAQDAIFVQDGAGAITYWNKSAERLYGWTADEMGRTGNLADFFAFDEEKVKEARDAVLAKGEWNGELRQKNKAGAEVTVDSRWTLVVGRAEGGHSFLCINTDITERKRIEAQFLRAQRMESIGTLAGGIAHDLNNVLAPILMGAEMLRDGALDPRSAKLVGTIESSARRGRDMVKQILGFARGQSGEQSVLQLGHLLKEMDKIMRETFPKNIQTRVTLGADLWPILGDATQLHQVLLNLCVNARDAMPDGGEIHLQSRNLILDEAAAQKLVGAKPGRYLLLSASDTGTGMAPEILQKIFEPFFTTKEVGKGTGLGLSTTLTIIKNHRGVLDVESTIGKGTTFKIYLPADASAVVAAPETPDRETLRGKNELVLVVDDEPAVREMAESTLAQNGYRVVCAAHGGEALAACSESKEKISLVLMDMMMPVMSGPVALRLLRRQFPAIRPVIMSGQPPGDKHKEQFGDTPFLAKPFTTDQLLKTLRKTLAA